MASIGLALIVANDDKKAQMGQGTHRTLRRDHDKLEAYRVWLSLPPGEQKYTTVAEELGIPTKTAENRVKAALEMMQEDTQKMRIRLFLDSLEVKEAMRKKAIGLVDAETGELLIPDPVAANAYYKGNEQDRKLFGLDMPVKTDITSDGEAVTVVFSQALTPKPQE